MSRSRRFLLLTKAEHRESGVRTSHQRIRAFDRFHRAPLFKSIELYQKELATMDDEAVEAEYAAQNWYISAVVHRKLLAVRRAIVFFFVGVGLEVLSYLTLP